MAIRIRSKKDGFRRAGHTFSEAAQLYPDDAFTPEELERIKAEPMLLVETGLPDDELPARESTTGEELAELRRENAALRKALEDLAARLELVEGSGSRTPEPKKGKKE